MPHDAMAMDGSTLTVAINEDVEAITALVGTELFEGDDFLGVRHGRGWRRLEGERGGRRDRGVVKMPRDNSITNGLISIRHAF